MFNGHAGSNAQALLEAETGSRQSLAIERIARHDVLDLGPARPRAVLVSDSVLDDLAADFALVPRYATDAIFDAWTLPEPRVAGNALVLKSTPRPDSEQQSNESTPRLENLVQAAGYSGFGASVFAVRKSKSKKLPLR